MSLRIISPPQIFYTGTGEPVEYVEYQEGKSCSALYRMPLQNRVWIQDPKILVSDLSVIPNTAQLLGERALFLFGNAVERTERTRVPNILDFQEGRTVSVPKKFLKDLREWQPEKKIGEFFQSCLAEYVKNFVRTPSVENSIGQKLAVSWVSPVPFPEFAITFFKVFYIRLPEGRRRVDTWILKNAQKQFVFYRMEGNERKEKICFQEGLMNFERCREKTGWQFLCADIECRQGIDQYVRLVDFQEVDPFYYDLDQFWEGADLSLPIDFLQRKMLQAYYDVFVKSRGSIPFLADVLLKETEEKCLFYPPLPLPPFSFPPPPPFSLPPPSPPLARAPGDPPSYRDKDLSSL